MAFAASPTKTNELLRGGGNNLRRVQCVKFEQHSSQKRAYTDSAASFPMFLKSNHFKDGIIRYK